MKFEDFPLSLQRKTKSRNTAVNTIEKAYENVNKTNEEDIATIEVIEKKFEKLCSLNSEIEELAEDAENNKKISDGCLQSEANITKRTDTLKSLVDKEKGLIKYSDANLKVLNVNL